MLDVIRNPEIFRKIQHLKRYPSTTPPTQLCVFPTTNNHGGKDTRVKEVNPAVEKLLAEKFPRSPVSMPPFKTLCYSPHPSTISSKSRKRKKLTMSSALALKVEKEHTRREEEMEMVRKKNRETDEPVIPEEPEIDIPRPRPKEPPKPKVVPSRKKTTRPKKVKKSVSFARRKSMIEFVPSKPIRLSKISPIKKLRISVPNGIRRQKRRLSRSPMYKIPHIVLEWVKALGVFGGVEPKFVNDWRSGVHFAHLINRLTNEEIRGVNKNPKRKAAVLFNLRQAMEILKNDRSFDCKYVFDIENIFLGKRGTINGLLLGIYHHFKVKHRGIPKGIRRKGRNRKKIMGRTRVQNMRAKILIFQQWLKRIEFKYNEIQNLAENFRDGGAGIQNDVTNGLFLAALLNFLEHPNKVVTSMIDKPVLVSEALANISSSLEFLKQKKSRTFNVFKAEELLAGHFGVYHKIMTFYENNRIQVADIARRKRAVKVKTNPFLKREKKVCDWINALQIVQVVTRSISDIQDELSKGYFLVKLARKVPTAGKITYLLNRQNSRKIGLKNISKSLQFFRENCPGINKSYLYSPERVYNFNRKHVLEMLSDIRMWFDHHLEESTKKWAEKRKKHHSFGSMAVLQKKKRILAKKERVEKRKSKKIAGNQGVVVELEEWVQEDLGIRIRNLDLTRNKLMLFQSGLLLIKIIEILEGGRALPNVEKNPKRKANCMYNIAKVLELLRKKKKMKLTHLWSNEEIFNGDRVTIINLLKDIKNAYT